MMNDRKSHADVVWLFVLLVLDTIRDAHGTTQFSTATRWNNEFAFGVVRFEDLTGPNTLQVFGDPSYGEGSHVIVNDIAKVISSEKEWMVIDSEDKFHCISCTDATKSLIPTGVSGKSVKDAWTNAADPGLTCVLFQDVTVESWGYTNTDSKVPTRLTDTPGIVADVVQFMYGYCAILSDSTVECWGDNTKKLSQRP